MKIKWLGHASFLITSKEGIKILTDPYKAGAFGVINYGKIDEPVDIVTISHNHDDHNGIAGLRGSPVVVQEAGTKEVKGISFNGLSTYHDAFGGRERGGNIVYYFAVDGLVVCHLGDLGHLLSDQQIAKTGKVDILLVPVGGTFTINATEATQLCEKMNPRIIIPMHYKTAKCALPIISVDDFLKGKEKVKRLASSEIELRTDELPSVAEIVVLQPAL